MLVLSIKAGEGIQIGPNCVVKVSDVRGGNRVKLAIQAPKDLRVERLTAEEVTTSIQSEETKS